MVTPFKNLVEFTKRRPPQVICTLCLVLLAVATLSFAFYVRKSGQLVDSDAEESWNSFKRYFNGLRGCVRKSSTKYFYKEEEANVAVSAGVVLNGTNKYGYAEGIVPLAGWHSKCSKTAPVNVKISFNIPKGDARREACIIISGPEEFLPRYTESECFAGPRLEVPGNSAQVFFIKDQNECTDGDTIEINLDTTKRQDFAVYLNETDKSNIYVHLLWLSFVMVFGVIIVVIYAMFARHGEKK